MPSPPVSRSSSSARAHSLIPPPSNRSVCSAPSTAKLSYRRLGNFIIPGRKSSDSSSKLSEESLEAHNRRHTPVIHHKFTLNEKKAKCSPYCKGLTYASPVISRERFVSSPGRESHAISISSSLSSFMLKMQEWSSCFAFKSPATVPLKKHNPPPTSSSYSPVTTSAKEIKLDVYPEKPLRERVSQSSTSKDTNIQMDRAKEFIWVNKYQPKTLKDFICNRDKVIQLQDLVEEGGCRNFIFEGPPVAGKRTMICAMLREEFGPETVQTREACKVFDLKGKLIGSIKVNVKESSQHIELNVSDLKGYEKHVILELKRETQSKLSDSNPDSSKAIILPEADKLSTDALLYIGWLLERHKGLNNVFFCCSDVSKLQPIKSLCTVGQLFPPSKQEMVEVLEFTAKQEGLELPHEFAEKIANEPKNNLRQAIRSFEASWQMEYKCSYPFKDNHQILTGWEDDITNIAKKIIEEQSPKQLYIIRGKLQNLIEHDVSLEFILKGSLNYMSLVEELKKHLDVGLHSCVDNLYHEYNANGIITATFSALLFQRDDGGMFDDEKPFVFARNTRHEEIGKNVQHLLRIEEFIAKFMSRYKTRVKNNGSEQQDTAA